MSAPTMPPAPRTSRTFARLASLAALGAATVIVPATTLAQDPTPATPAGGGPPIRRVATASAVSKELIGSVTGIRELPDGRVLLNDGSRRRLIVLDTAMTVVGTVLDSIAEIENTYGTRAGILIPYRADSTLFVDPASYVVLVLGPDGRVARIRSVWRVSDVNALSGGGSGSFGGGGPPAVPGVDAKGRLVYRVQAEPGRPLVAPPRGTPWFPQEPDSAFVVAIDIDTRKLDTLGAIRTPKRPFTVTRTANGSFNWNGIQNPLPWGDDFAVLSDGTVAFVRARDYRVEYLGADGALTSSPKLPFEWVRLTDSLKQRLIDSVRTTEERQLRTQYATQMIRWVNTYGKQYPADFAVPAGYSIPQGWGRGWRLPEGLRFPERYVFACAVGEEPVMLDRPGGAPVVAGRGDSTARADSSTPRLGVDRPAGDRGAGDGPRGGAGGRGAGGRAGADARGADARGAGGRGGGVRPDGGPVGAGGIPGMGGGAEGGVPSCIPGPAAGSNVPPMPTLRAVRVMDAADLPDYRPPLGQGSLTRADLDGNLWIRTTPPTPVRGGPVFDIVSRAGELVDRIQIPTGYTLVGFGRGRVVYLSMRDAAGLHLARVRLR